MKLAIMQPYFFPYIGYFQLINAVDKFVVYDNIEFSKRGWFHRNRILINGKDKLFTIPLKKDSDYLNVNERFLAATAKNEINKILQRIINSYKNAPYFESCFELIKECFLFPDNNLFSFIFNSVSKVCTYLNIDTEIIISSKIKIDHNLKGKNKVIAICKELEADYYINPIGGVNLYNKKEFLRNGIKLKFIKPENINYKQFDNEFIPNLSIIDVMMFNSKDEIKRMLEDYELI